MIMEKLKLGDFVYCEKAPYSYLTKNKRYKVLCLIDENLFIIENDLGRNNCCLLKNCAHLDWGNWIIDKKRNETISS